MSAAASTVGALPVATRAGRAVRSVMARRGLVVLFLLAGAAGLVVVLYAAGVHAFGGSSDGATVVLEGQALRGGDIGLHGWALSLDSFWTVDVVLNALGVLIVGLHASLLALVPAVVAVLVVAVGVAASLQRPGPGGWVGAIGVLALLGLPGPTLSYFLLQGAQHVGLALWCLVAFVALRRGRFGVGWALAVVFLAAGILGDFQAIALGVIPVLLGGVVATLRQRALSAGLVPISAAAASLALAGAVHELVRRVGGFTLVSANPTAHLAQMATNLSHLPFRFAALLGVGSVPVAGVPAGPLAEQAVHVVGLVIVLGALAVSLVRMVGGALLGAQRGEHAAGEGWRLDDLLVIAFAGDLATFVVVSGTGNGHYARYLTPGVIFAAVLAGRRVGELADVLRRRRSLAALGVVAGLAVVGAFAYGLSASLSSPAAPKTAQSLGRFLEAHGLHDGIGDYWSASIVTVRTDGAVRVRPVIRDPAGQLERYDRQSSASWFAGQRFQFLAFSAGRPWRGVDEASAVATFGQPAQDYVVSGYRVLVWSHPLLVSASGYTRP